MENVIQVLANNIIYILPTLSDTQIQQKFSYFYSSKRNSNFLKDSHSSQNFPNYKIHKN